MSFEGKHSDALAKVRRYGAPVSFDTTTPGEYNPATDTQEDPVVSSVAGHAVETPGDPEEYEVLELIGTGAVTLMFVPTVYGETPKLGSTAHWAGALRTVKQIFPIRPDGVLIAARVILV